MKNTTKRYLITTVAVILASAVIMLILQLINNGFLFTAVDWQSLVLKSVMLDAIVFAVLACIDARKSKLKRD